ncbi:MAG TPA: winged helix-turn-helix transcriptional regulator, partial [Candidatus Thermoplasmatota archaeon]|nr:winged helix-turn-helix transcriptional regulator [Candidatus Thermoplasmatota archaeon]
MARSILLPTRAVRPMTERSLDLLDETAMHARGMFSAFVRLPPSGTARLLDATMSFMRRWSVEIVLVVGEKGSATFGELSRALGGLRSGSLTPRLRELEATGILARRPAGDAQGRVLYELTADARPLADASYALTLGKAYHHARVREASWAKPLAALDRATEVRMAGPDT